MITTMEQLQRALIRESRRVPSLRLVANDFARANRVVYRIGGV